MSDLVTDIDKYKQGWTGGLPETPCGHGSKLFVTKKQREWIPEIIEKYGIKSIDDIGAGDMNWIKKTDLKGVKYTPYDLVPRETSVIEFNLVEQVPDKVDMIMCLWVLNHFPYDSCVQAIKNIKASGSKYLMMTDRLRYREDQPNEIDMPYVDKLVLNDKGDSIMLIDLDIFR